MNSAYRILARRSARIPLALFFIVGMTLAASAATQQRALASSCAAESAGTITIFGQKQTDLIIPSNTTCYNVVLEHVCKVMGGNGGVEAIECADIDASWTYGQIEVWGEGEYYCQGSDGYARCAAMSVDQLMKTNEGAIDGEGTGTEQYGHPGGNYTCSGSSCSTARAMVSTYHFTYDGNDTAYAIVNADDATNSITVPDGDKITDPSPPSTPIISLSAIGG